MDTIISLDKLFLFVGVFFAVCAFVIVAIFIDLWDGVYTARKTAQKVHSHKLRVTVSKISEYFRLIMLGFLLDGIGVLFSFYPLPVVSMIFGAGLIGVEIKSILEHIRRRKSHASEITDIIRGIVDCANEKDAKRLVALLMEQKEETETKK